MKFTRVLTTLVSWAAAVWIFTTTIEGVIAVQSAVQATQLYASGIFCTLLVILFILSIQLVADLDE